MDSGADFSSPALGSAAGIVASISTAAGLSPHGETVLSPDGKETAALSSAVAGKLNAKKRVEAKAKAAVKTTDSELNRLMSAFDSLGLGKKVAPIFSQLKKSSLDALPENTASPLDAFLGVSACCN